MFTIHTVNTLLIVFVMFIMKTSAASDRLLSAKKRTGFQSVFLLIAICTTLEWFSVYFDNQDASYHISTAITSVLLFTLLPLVPIILAETITNLKHIKIFIAILVLNFIIQLLSVKYGFVFYVDAQNNYTREEYYFLYCIIASMSMAVLYYSIFDLAKKYQSRKNYILFHVLLLSIIGVIMQVVNIERYSIWPTSAIASILIYLHHNSLINQIDPVTSLFNRRCFENERESLKTEATIIIFDIDKFKSINDIHGHSFGDFCLAKIGNAISEQYGHYGTCYRIGGDEFCVILEKKFNEVEKLNKLFHEKVLNLKFTESKMPLVSVGYGHYDPNKNTFHDALSAADNMMYKNKRNNS